MTALENIMVGRHRRTRSGFLASGFRLPMFRRESGRRGPVHRRSWSLIGLERYARSELAVNSRWVRRSCFEMGSMPRDDPELISYSGRARRGLNDTETARTAS